MLVFSYGEKSPDTGYCDAHPFRSKTYATGGECLWRAGLLLLFEDFSGDIVQHVPEVIFSEDVFNTSGYLLHVLVSKQIDFLGILREQFADVVLVQSGNGVADIPHLCSRFSE